MLDVLELLWAATDPSWFQSLGARVWNIGLVVFGLGFVIFVHELGHFLAAKACGVKVEKFFVGFDVPLQFGPIKLPSKLGSFRWGETEYGIGVIPLGGYVRMLGQDDNPQNAQTEAERIRTTVDDPTAPGGKRVVLDPRSYQAKPVLQRMAIISAGVVMNLIFAVILAALAFGFGVNYEPAMIGGLQAGDPAWMAGVRPGGQIVSVGGLQDDRELHFRDMQMEVFASGLRDATAAVPFTIDYDGQLKSLELVPTKRHDPKGMRGTIGIVSLPSNRIAADAPVLSELPTSQLLADLRGRSIAAVDELVLEDNDGNPVPIAGVLLKRHLFQHFDQPVTLTFAPSQPGESKSIVTLPAQPRRTLGFELMPGPITAVRPGSPADRAGLVAGDEIVAVDGQPVNDAIDLAMLLDTRPQPRFELQVRSNEKSAENPRDDEPLPPGQIRTVSIEGEPLQSMLEPALPGSLLASDRLGIAFACSPRVARSTAAAATDDPVANGAQLQPGDLIRKLQVVWPTGGPSAELDEILQTDQLAEEGIEIDQFTSMLNAMQILQLLPIGTQVRVTFTRDNYVEQTLLTLTEDPARSWIDRGLILQPYARTHTADSLGGAIRLGLRETWRRVTQVVDFLKMLVTGRVGLGGLGGPGSIVYLASGEADAGITRLLLFLTLLSANLAILNFVPIPALDGGHMMFLTAELITGRPVSERLQATLTMCGVVALLALMAVAIFNDVNVLSRL